MKGKITSIATSWRDEDRGSNAVDIRMNVDNYVDISELHRMVGNGKVFIYPDTRWNRFVERLVRK